MAEVREATVDDLDAIREIYNAAITDSLAVWREEPVDEAERREWFERKCGAGEPVLVAVEVGDDEAAGDVVGFATYGRFRDHSGYNRTAEHTLHVREGFRDRGAGALLLEALVDRAREADKHVLVAGIGAQNEGSLRFHSRHGFSEVGRMPEVGHKHDRRLDLVLLQRVVG